MSDIRSDEVSKAIQRLKNGKSSGLDGINAELLKCGGHLVIEKLTELCNQVWIQSKVPTDWKDGNIIPLPKKAT